MRFFVCILVLLFVHNQFSRADKTLIDDSLYTEKYIRMASRLRLRLHVQGNS